jgi:gamma-glutamyltranspeptidase
VPAQIDRVTGRAFATRSEVIASHGMVCTSQPLAPQIGLDVLKAGGSTDYDHPKMRDGGYVYLESGIPWGTVAELKRRGYDIRTDLGGFGGYQAIMWDAKNRVYCGASESRKDGQADGY